MCGIAGYIDLKNKVSKEVIVQMTNAISHRGPDGDGHELIDNVAIGHRRLSIIDLASGAQPMANADKSIWITYNGELYNYKEIKSELELDGIVFKTSSDTEVIIYAYQKWKHKCLERFRGMFAFAIVDVNERKILLAKDHFGIKPLFLYKHQNTIAFASELQQFRAIPGFNKELNVNAIDQYLWMQYVPAPLTIFKSVRKLKAAHYVYVTFDGDVGEEVCYWQLDFGKKRRLSEGEWLEEADKVIGESVKAHLVADVPFGAFLSGGIDSSLVVSYMSKQLTRPVETFSIGFEEKEYNELEYSEQVARKYGTNHHVEIVKPDALSVLPNLVKHYGEPFGDSSCIPTYYVCKLARKHVTMVLSGDGGDEAFAGYNSYTQFLKHQPINFRSGLKKVLFPLAEKFWPSRYPPYATLEKWISTMSYLENDWRNKLWKKEWHSYMATVPDGFEAAWNMAQNWSMMNRNQYLDMKTYMNFDILTKVDVASMMNSLEVRTPLIDKNVWEFAATIPEEMNINNVSGEWRGKQILKGLIARDFPDEFINRKKQGFGVPVSKWFAKEGQLNEYLMDRLLSVNSKTSLYLNREGIQSLMEIKHTGALWLILFLEEWLNQFEK
jgi:asparagine synthase (glutamine-hydrolysing)